jgi:hypothetical protein
MTAVGYEPSSIHLAEAFYPENVDIPASAEAFSLKFSLYPQELAQYFNFFAAMPRAAEGMVTKDCSILLLSRF